MPIDPTVGNPYDPEERNVPGQGEPRFLLAPSGTVHVEAESRSDGGEADDSVDRLGLTAEQRGLLAWAAGREFTRCGRHIDSPGMGAGISVFDDADLCRSCWRTWPEAHIGELFEHETP